MRLNLLLLFTLSVLFHCSQAQVNPYNAFHPGEQWNDSNGVPINAHGGGMLWYNQRWYWFGEHKVAGTAGNVAHVGVHCYSSSDLYNWKDEGIALKVMHDTTSDLQEGCILERPKVIYNDSTRRFVMWFHIEQKNKGYGYARAGVAVASDPAGPYTYVKSVRSNPGKWPVNVLEVNKRPVAAEVMQTYYPGGGFPQHPDSLNLIGKFFREGQMSRDLTLFKDDDGKAYQVYASEYNSTIQIAELTDDYLSYTGKYVRAFVGRFMEAPAVFKKDGLYYMLGSGTTGWLPNAARSAVAPSIWGPWTELGNPCVGADSEYTFHAQATYVLPVAGRPDSFIMMADRWNPSNAIDGRYVWLPLFFRDGKPQVRWRSEWKLEDLLTGFPHPTD